MLLDLNWAFKLVAPLADAWLPVLVTSGVLALLIGAALLVVKQLADSDFRHPLATAVTLVCLLVSFACCMLVPLDVFEAEHHQTANSKSAWQTLFALLALLSFVGLPFAFFFVDDSFDDEDEEGGDADLQEIVDMCESANCNCRRCCTCCSKALNALKYT